MVREDSAPLVVAAVAVWGGMLAGFVVVDPECSVVPVSL